MPEKLSHGPRTAYDARVGAGLSRGPSLRKKLNAAPWSGTWPAPSATLDLDFANDRGFVRGVGQGRSMDAVTFTRASVGRFVDQDGLLQEAANNAPRFDWARTDSTGAGTIADPRVIPLRANPTSNGLLIEEARTNRLLWNRDATDAAWVKTDVTAAKDQTGIDGVANAASSLTSTADNGTCIQTITLASGSRTGSVFLKRITGAGNVQVSLDGSTWSTVDLSDTEWRRIVLSGTVTNPTVGIRLAVSGDAVAMDYGQVEDGAFATSPILTTTASVTRAVDSASLTGQNFAGVFPYKTGSVYYEFTPLNAHLDSLVLAVTNSINEGITLRYNQVGYCRLLYKALGTPLVHLSPPLLSTVKQAGSWSPQYFCFSINGQTASTAFNAGDSLQDLRGIWFGSVVAVYNNTKFIKRVVLYPKQLSENAIQELTK
jgi:hypothetical protein